MENLFFELLRVSLGRQDCLSREPIALEWNGLYNTAEKHALLGICYAGIKALPNNAKTFPAELAMQWLADTTHIVQQSEKHEKIIGKVSSYLKMKGVDAIFMKGLICASRYPQPE